MKFLLQIEDLIDQIHRRVLKLKLFRVQFEGYKRFLKSTILKVNGKMTVLIGPNEAGKSTTLKILAHLSNSTEFLPHERYKFSEGVKAEISAEFYLDSDDHNAIGSSIPTKYVLTKKDDGKLYHEIEPKVLRPKDHRASFRRKLTKCVESKFFNSIVETDESTIEQLNRDAKSINFDSETISEANLQVVSDVSSVLESAIDTKSPKYIVNFEKEISTFLEIENKDHPNKLALKTIGDRCPKILEFTEEDRKLETTYNIGHYKHEDPNQSRDPCAALINLCEVAGLDLDSIKANYAENKPDRIREQFDNANLRLKELFNRSWSQSDISIFLDWDKPNIQIMVQQQGHESLKYNMIDDRSDGFRQYVALLAFIIKEDAHKPILLIDEAELHLHYDAQADLIQTFTTRELTSQVVYTTHSAGCLPEDLGLGVKLVTQVEAEDNFATSKIVNNFWDSNTLGFSPILYGMGAQTLAFFPTRQAVVTEGPTEMLLMPTIFRQVSGAEFNGFQIVPGLATASKKKLPASTLQGLKVSYVVDNDEAGATYLKDLTKAGIKKGQLFKVSSSNKSIVTIEDWVCDKCFSEAMETYRNRYFAHKEGFKEKYFYGDGKAKKLEDYEKLVSETISKPTLAYIILEISENDPSKLIYNSKHKKAISDLRVELIKSFEDIT